MHLFNFKTLCFTNRLIKKCQINIIYFVMTYYITKNILIISYLFYNLYKISFYMLTDFSTYMFIYKNIFAQCRCINSSSKIIRLRVTNLFTLYIKLFYALIFLFVIFIFYYLSYTIKCSRCVIFCSLHIIICSLCATFLFAKNNYCLCSYDICSG